MEEMELDEAKRRFEKILILSGYSLPSGPWKESYDGKIKIYSKYLEDLYGSRAVLWQEKDGWETIVSLKVGEWGEFPLFGNRLTRWNSDKWYPPTVHEINKRIWEVATQIRRWDQYPSNSLGYLAMIKLALSYFNLGISNLSWIKVKKGKSILMGAVKGEISKATISESLSIVQYKWCRSREERLRSSLIWSQTFR